MTDGSSVMLLKDGSRLDWPKGRYERKVRGAFGPRRTSCMPYFGATSLERAVNEGIANWAAEVRCPKTLLSRIALSSEPQHTEAWRQEELDGVSWIVPGLVDVQEFELQAEELNPL